MEAAEHSEVWVSEPPDFVSSSFASLTIAVSRPIRNSAICFGVLILSESLSSSWDGSSSRWRWSVCGDWEKIGSLPGHSFWVGGSVEGLLK